MEVKGKYSNIERTTDADGRIEIHGEIGDSLGIATVTKEGYLLSPKAPRGFGTSSASFQNPVIFKMWKEGGNESLIDGNKVFGIDSRITYTLNLFSGTKTEGIAEGDLLVSITRPQDAKPRNNFAWSFSIQGIQGGLVEADTNDEFMYIAPKSGYQPKFEMQFDPDDPAWVGIIKKRFFICSRNGQVYGRAEIEIDSIYNVHSAIRVKYTINPNGSRNLQP